MVTRIVVFRISSWISSKQQTSIPSRLPTSTKMIIWIWLLKTNQPPIDLKMITRANVLGMFLSQKSSTTKATS